MAGVARSIASHADARPTTPRVSERTAGARAASRRQWLADLRTLLDHAQTRFGDVSWTDPADASSSAPAIWAHKAIVYARSTAPWQARFLGAHVSSPLPGSMSSLNLLSVSSPETNGSIASKLWSRSPSPGAMSLASIIPKRTSSVSPAPTDLTASTMRAPHELTASDYSMLEPSLRYFYTAEDAESFGFLFDDALASSPTLSPDAAENRLREDFVYLWRSKLYADVQLEIEDPSVVAPTEPVYFTVHRAILSSRCPYFAALMLAPYADRDARLLRLPASAGFTASSLHFILGAIYAGSLDFSPRSFDLATAFDIYRACTYLGLDTVRDEAEARIEDMAGGFASTTPAHAKRSARILAFTARGDVACPRLAAQARRAVVHAWPEAFGAPELAELDRSERESMAEDVALAIDAEAAIAALASVMALRSRAPDSAIVLELVEPAERRIRTLLGSPTSLPIVVASAPFAALLEGHLFALNREVLQRALSLLVAALDDAGAAQAYESIVGGVLLREDGLPMDARSLVEDARQNILKYIKRRWVAIRALDGFAHLPPWALKEVADEIEQKPDDLLAPIIDTAPSVMSRTGLRSSVAKRPSVGSDAASGTTSLRASVVNRTAARNSIASNSTSTFSRRTPAANATRPIEAAVRASPVAPPAPKRAPPPAPIDASKAAKMTTASSAPLTARRSSVHSSTAGTSSVVKPAARTPTAPSRPPLTAKTPTTPTAARPRSVASVASSRTTASSRATPKTPPPPAASAASAGPSMAKRTTTTTTAGKAPSVTSSVRTRASVASTATTGRQRTSTAGSDTATTPAPRRTTSSTSVRTTRSTTGDAAKKSLRSSTSAGSLGKVVPPVPAPAPIDPTPALPLAGAELRVPLPALIHFDSGGKGKALVRFIGRVGRADAGQWVGIEVSDQRDRTAAGPSAKWSDGTRAGVRYFTPAADDRGLWVRPKQVVYLL